MNQAVKRYRIFGIFVDSLRKMNIVKICDKMHKIRNEQNHESFCLRSMVGWKEHKGGSLCQILFPHMAKKKS
jgi:hypothetical protein